MIFVPQVDFPAVTICNINRVNCHNAFVAFYNMKTALADPSLNETQRVFYNFSILICFILISKT